MQIPILHQDGDIVVINKPISLATHAAGAADPCGSNALHVVQAQLGLDYLGSPQRMGAETSGVLLLTTRREVNTALAEAFTGRAVERVYLALAHGTPPRRAGVVDAPITRESGERERYRITTPREKRGQRAVTRYQLLETSPGDRYSLLEVIPETGQGDHQTRAHLAHLGVPVVGDALYGAESETAPRLGLHVSRLTFPHPTTGQQVTFVAPPPPLFTRLATGLPELTLAGRHVRRIKPDAAGVAELLTLALARRAPLADDPQTTLYRLINAAGDGLPGLAVDRYGDALVVSVYDEIGRPEPLAAGWIERLAEATHAGAIYVKYRQRQASRVDEEALPALAPSKPIIGRPLGEYPAHEDGLAYLVRPGEGWNPGIFPDMREMRARVRAWASGKRVLNCFAYTCGFGLAALAGGAARVVNLDVSWPSLERGGANYRANGFVPDATDFLYGDTFDWLPRLARQPDRFDIVILDPPGFARTKTHTFSAAHDYGKLSQAAAAVIAPAGLLVACCNVADLSLTSFRNRVVAGLDAAWRAAEIVGVYQAPALDFPTSPNRESHLKVLVARLA